VGNVFRNFKKHFSVMCLIRLQFRQDVHKGSAHWWHTTVIVVEVNKYNHSLTIDEEGDYHVVLPIAFAYI